jgi:hypothetical protein
MAIPGDLLGGLIGGGPLRLIGPGYATRLAFARSSAATLEDGSGLLQTASSNVLRFSGSAGRALLEGQRTNSIRNPRCEGAAAGVVGSGGALPTNWRVDGSMPTITVVGTGVEDGIPCVDLSFTSAGAGTPWALGFGSAGEAAAATGQTWASSFYCRLIAGSLAGIALQKNFLVNGSAQQISQDFAPSGAALAGQRQMLVGTLSTAGATAVVHRIRATSSAAYNMTLRIGAPQLEKGGSISSLLLPPVAAPAAASRAADLLSATATAFFPSLGGTVLLGGLLAQPAPGGGADQLVLQIDDGTAANALLLRNAAGTASFLAGRVLAGAVANTAASGGFTPGLAFALGFAFDGSGLSMLLRGDSEKTIATAMPSGLTTLRVGAGLAGADPLFGEISGLTILPYRASAAEMALHLAGF